MLRAAVIAFSLLLPCSSFAQPTQEQQIVLDGLYRFYVFMAQSEMKGFKRVVSPEEKALLDRVRISIDRNQYNIAAVFATKDGDIPIISISIGFLQASYAINTAFIYEADQAARTGKSPDLENILDYIDYVADSIGRTDYESYLKWSDLNEEEIKAAATQLEKNEFGNANVGYTSFAFVLAHEIGHHVLGHVGVRTGEKEEAAADKYGIELLLKAGYNPALASTTFILFNAINPHGTVPRIARTHPEAYCRWMSLTLAGWKSVVEDQAFLADMKAQGRESEIDKLNELGRSITSSPTDCDK